jgi:hypothetical protein
VGFYHAVPGYVDGQKTFQRGTSLHAGLGGGHRAVGAMRDRRNPKKPMLSGIPAI